MNQTTTTPRAPSIGAPVELIGWNRHAAVVTDVGAIEDKPLITVRKTNSPGHNQYQYQFLLEEEGWQYVTIREDGPHHLRGYELKIP